MLIGEVDSAIKTYNQLYSIWKNIGFLPEGYNIRTNQPVGG